MLNPFQFANRYAHCLLAPYYKRFQKRILSAGPIFCNSSGEVEIHILTSKRDLLNAVWAIATFYYFSEIKAQLLIHGDGSLDEDSVRLLTRLFPNCRVILKQVADKAVSDYLKKYPNCLRSRLDHALSIKVFDFFLFSETKRIFILDSDILFFKRPSELLSAMKNQQIAFMTDLESSSYYSLSSEKLQRIFGIQVIEALNSGLMFLPSLQGYDLPWIEDYLVRLLKEKDTVTYFLEQTAWALIASRSAQDYVRLPDSYQISGQAIGERTISHHFVNDGSRIYFYTRGISSLKKRRFLDALPHST